MSTLLSFIQNFMERDIYTIKATLNRFHPKISRTLQIKGTLSLSCLADEILKSFDFVLDHNYGFFSNYKSMDDSLEQYTSFMDHPERNFGLDDDPLGFVTPRIKKGVANVAIREVFEPTKRMLFNFNYGDSWEFIVECTTVGYPKDGVTYPRVSNVRGVAPKQYPEPESDIEDD